MMIDFHAHFVPPGSDSLEVHVDGGGLAGWRWDRARGTVHISGRLRAMPGATDAPWFAELSGGVLTSVEARLAWMDRVGVNRQVLSVPPYLNLYEAPVGEAWRASRLLNEGLADIARTYPQRFSAFATIPLQDPALAARELEYCIGELGMLGVQILTHVNGRDLDEVEFIQFWDVVNHLGVPVFLHPHLPTDRARMRHHYMVNALGNPHETALACGHLVFGGVLDRNPGLRLVLAHGGGVLGSGWGRWRHAAKRIPEAWVARDDFDSYLRHFYIDTVTHDAAGLARMIQMVGADHVVLGSDYPYDMGDSAPVAALARVPGITSEQVHQIGAAGLLLSERAARASEGSA